MIFGLGILTLFSGLISGFFFSNVCSFIEEVEVDWERIGLDIQVSSGNELAL